MNKKDEVSVSLMVYLANLEEEVLFINKLADFLGTEVELHKIDSLPNVVDIIADFRFLCLEEDVCVLMDKFLNEQLEEFSGIKYNIVGFRVLDYDATYQYVTSSIFWLWKTLDTNSESISILAKENKRLSAEIVSMNDRLNGVTEELRAYRQIPSYYSILKELCEIMDCEELMENVKMHRLQ